jgi:hypothetical protein
VGEGGPRRAKAVFGGFKWAEAGGFDSFNLVSARLRPPWPAFRSLLFMSPAADPASALNWTMDCDTARSIPGFMRFMRSLFVLFTWRHSRPPYTNDQTLAHNVALSNRVAKPGVK